MRQEGAAERAEEEGAEEERAENGAVEGADGIEEAGAGAEKEQLDNSGSSVDKALNTLAPKMLVPDEGMTG